jgi:hypothetical protein
MKAPIIGTLNEKALHAQLKDSYAKPGDRLEVVVEGYVIDILRNGCLIEIQTGNFASIKSKVLDLTARHPLRLVYPIAYEKWILKLPQKAGDPETRRKSPKRGRISQIFNELVSFPEVLKEPNFSLEVLIIQEEEIRRYVGKKRWRNQGWVTEERRLIAILENHVFYGCEQLRDLIPSGLPLQFTSLDIAKAMGTSRRLAQKAAYCYQKTGIIQQVGKRGRSKLYTLNQIPK